MSANPQAREPLWDIVEESLDEAEFLWSRWESDLSSLTRNLDEVYIWSEDRLHGALDGVRAGGAQSLGRFLLPALEGDNLQRMTVSAHLMAQGSGPAALASLAHALKTAEGKKLDALLRGIETAPLDGSFVQIANQLAQGDPVRCAALCRLKSFRRSAVGAELAAALAADDPAHRAQGLRSASFAGQNAAHLIEAALPDKDADVVVAAIESGLRLQLPAAWTAVRERARAATPADAALLRWAAALGGHDDFAVILDALGKAPLTRHALYALGHVGNVEAVEGCLAHMAGEHARAAGEAYCAITGAELELDRLSAPEPDEPAPEFEADDLDANLVSAAHELWPLPNPDAVRAHWNGINARFESGGRYLMGQPRNSQTLMQRVASAPMLRRPDWIFAARISRDAATAAAGGARRARSKLSAAAEE